MQTLITFNEQGQVIAVHIIATTDEKASIVEYGLSKLTKSDQWGWMRRLLCGPTVAPGGSGDGSNTESNR